MVEVFAQVHRNPIPEAREQIEPSVEANNIFEPQIEITGNKDEVIVENNEILSDNQIESTTLPDNKNPTEEFVDEKLKIDEKLEEGIDKISHDGRNVWVMGPHSIGI